LNRASRTGPLCVMNQGTEFFAPFNVATASRGFGPGSIRLHSAASGMRDIGLS
jgi:hypothetical protein